MCQSEPISLLTYGLGMGALLVAGLDRRVRARPFTQAALGCILYALQMQLIEARQHRSPAAPEPARWAAAHTGAMPAVSLLLLLSAWLRTPAQSAGRPPPSAPAVALAIVANVAYLVAYFVNGAICPAVRAPMPLRAACGHLAHEWFGECGGRALGALYCLAVYSTQWLYPRGYFAVFTAWLVMGNALAYVLFPCAVPSMWCWHLALGGPFLHLAMRRLPP